jgi:hypothetical protein
MLEQTDPRGSIGYVTLGLFSNALLRELFAIVDNKEKSVATIQNAIDSLKDLDQPVASEVGASEDLAFRSYQAYATLFDVLDSHQTAFTRPGEVASLLEGVLKAASLGERQANARQAIVFFRNLAKRAAVNSQVPQDEIPAGVRQLARQTTA